MSLLHATLPQKLAVTNLYSIGADEISFNNAGRLDQIAEDAARRAPG